ncbi:MAG: serine hydrolase domain-containing protein [Bacteroidota bacterium]
MKLKITILLLSTLLQEQLVIGQPAPFLELVEEHLLSFPNNVEVAIGIVDGDKTYKLGYRVIEGQLIAVNNASTLYEIGSISKTFVATLLTNEIEKGTMSLEDPIQKHFNSEIRQDTYQGQTLSLLHLATHTSGLKKNPLTSYKRYSSYLSKVQLDYVPGKKWEYNNMGVGLVGRTSS